MQAGCRHSMMTLFSAANGRFSRQGCKCSGITAAGGGKGNASLWLAETGAAKNLEPLPLLTVGLCRPSSHSSCRKTPVNSEIMWDKSEEIIGAVTGSERYRAACGFLPRHKTQTLPPTTATSKLSTTTGEGANAPTSELPALIASPAVSWLQFSLHFSAVVCHKTRPDQKHYTTTFFNYSV